MHARLCVEDPFEVNYDVAHPVKKQSRVELMRSEFIRVVSIVDKYKQDVSPPTCYS
jgi:hypothetical protein